MRQAILYFLQQGGEQMIVEIVSTGTELLARALGVPVEPAAAEQAGGEG